MYKIIFDKKVEKILSKLDSVLRRRILQKIFELEKTPHLGKHLLVLDLWSLRIGKYRVIYKIEEKKLEILVLDIDHRKSVYRFKEEYIEYNLNFKRLVHLALGPLQKA